MESWYLALGAGLIAGALHVISGPDHLAALAPLALQKPTQSLASGALWGAGHAGGVVVLGILGQVVGHLLDIELVSGWSEVVVGALLIVIGGWSIKKALGIVVHSHPHERAGEGPHEHVHVHFKGEEGEHISHRHAALGVGFLHGVAGAGHLFGVLPSLALPPTSAALYLAAYLVSAVSAMALFGGLLGRLALLKQGRAIRPAIISSGVVSILVGAYWAVSAIPGA